MEGIEFRCPNYTTRRLHELKRDMQARLMTVETYGGETFLSEEVAISILQETKNAFQRSTLVTRASFLLLVMREKRCTESGREDFGYPSAISLSRASGLCRGARSFRCGKLQYDAAGISLAEPKTEPPSYFYSVLQQNAAIVHLLVKQFDDSVYPLIK